MENLVVAAIGGNALVRRGARCTYEEQLYNAKRAAKALIPIVEKGFKLVITHGNGPQVGNIYLQQEECSSAPPMPLHVCVAMSQAMIGFILQTALEEEAFKMGLNLRVSTILTRVRVSEKDPAFRNPSKPIGPFYPEEEAKQIMSEKGWCMVYQPDKGWRRVVPSPNPLEIVEVGTIKELVKLDNTIIVCTGGGGIPVVKRGKTYYGVDAVIDKDLASSLLAQMLDAHRFIILTDVDGVYVNFRKTNQKLLRRVSVKELEQLYREGHSPRGSMGPKVLAAIDFVKSTGREAAIGRLDDALSVLYGEKGTTVVR